ncbi:hypothetical protein CBG25_16605 [Arsenophonus sp. ENCA]|uniref:gp53-like domain-containing protein n=1 Tax=Arsenophonus sp. ENCA TaxID=1987579 RepID=UPI000BCEDCE4|nr:hypothetical protein [Arsenophonus sp. ENCA]PAV01451.1 hypothetical protein CBG25_16605 [Arsenophonus sp. ENCA]
MLETVDCAKNALDKRTGGTVNGGVTLGQNLTISWGGRMATYHENGDITGPVWGGALSGWIIARANTSNVSRDGWWRCGETGIIMQWGYVGNTNVTHNFPLTFPHACFNVMASNADAQGDVVDNKRVA